MLDADLDRQLADAMADCYADPLQHVMISYPWGSGSLAGFSGPDDWARGYLIELGEEVRSRGFDGVTAVRPIRFSTASGHGIGKSALVAWLIRWIMDTRPQAKGVVTANTAAQLRSKTWAELAKWTNLGLTKHWFTLTGGTLGSLAYYHKAWPETWRVDAQTCEERNSEAFAGLHSATSTPFYIFDEASAVPDKIFEVREGGLTDGEPQIHDFGNPTRTSGRFFENMLGKFRNQFSRRFVDSRSVSITNKELIEEWRELYGEDSDFFKVRVLGQFPSASSMQFIPSDLVRHCMQTQVAASPADAIVVGVDVARFGGDRSCIFTRRGRDCTIYAPQLFHHLDTMQLAARVAEHAAKIRPDAIFVDGGGVGGGVVDRLNQLNVPVTEINFGARATDRGMANMRSQMWYRMREALKAGVALPDNDDLRADLTGVEYGFNSAQQVVLERKEDMKKRGLASPDMADALALTWALDVFPIRSADLPGSAHTTHTSSTDDGY